MKDNCYIDGISTYKQYGVWITRGGYNGILTFPEMETPEKNNWKDEDGIEVDLSSPALRPRQISISFLAERQTNIAEFVLFLSQPGYRTLHVPSLNREWEIRLLEHGANTVYPHDCSFTLIFMEDKFVKTESSLPTNGIGIRVPYSTYAIDGKYLHEYGITVQKSKSEFFKMPAIKQNLTQSFFGVDGQEYDAGVVFFSEKEVTFNCSIFAQDIDLFWLQYNTFFNSLIEPGERTFYADSTEQEYPCYYKKCSNFKLISLTGRVAASFSLTLVFSTFHVGETEYVLATEEDEDIVLEDGETLIDMK